MEKVKRFLGPIANLSFDSLMFAQLLSHFADAAVLFLLGAYIIKTTGEFGNTIAIAFASFFLPALILSPAAGVICDKFSKKTVMFLSCFVRFFVLLIAAILFKKPDAPVIFACTAAIGASSAFFYPAKMSIAPQISNKKLLKFSNAFLSPTMFAAFLIGSFFANIIELKSSEWTVFIVCSMYILASLLCLLIKTKVTNTRSVFSIFEFLKNHKKIFSAACSTIFTGFIISAVLNSFNAAATDLYGLAFLDLTVLRTILGFSLIAGALLFLVLAKFFKLKKIFSVSLIITLLIFLTSFLSVNHEITALWIIGTGIFSAMILIASDTILQSILPSALRGQCFGIVYAMNALGFLIGMSAIHHTFGFVDPVELLRNVSLGAFAVLVLYFAVLFFIRKKSV